jgi:hypothetical protein
LPAGKEAQMRKETATTSDRAIFPQGYTFTTVEKQAEITTAIRQLHGAGCAQIALVVITARLVYKDGAKSGRAKDQQSTLVPQDAAYLLQHIRSLVRRTDLVFLHQHTMYFVLQGANLEGAELVEERLWDALLCHTRTLYEQGNLRSARLTVGHGAFPDPHADLDALLRAASKISRRSSGRAERAGKRGFARGMPEEEPSSEQRNEDLSLLARKLGIPYLERLPRKPPQHVLHLVSARLAQELRCYPVGRERNMLTVAMLNPRDHQALERLHQETGLQIFPVLTHPEALESALERLN